MADQEISLGTMRFLFRLLDEDGGGSLSAGEIKRGMLLLGYPEAHDPLALGRLLKNIDEDQTGAVSESEFLSFMCDETRQSLHDKMSRWSLEHTYIHATRYAVAGDVQVETAELSCGSMEALIRSIVRDEDSKHVHWLDIVGYDPATFAALAAVLGVGHGVLSDALLFGVPDCCLLCGAALPTALLVLHHAKLSVDPILPRPATLLPASLSAVIDAIIGGDAVDIKAPKILRGCRLASKGDIADAAITLEQACCRRIDSGSGGGGGCGGGGAAL
jgi:hypothetical protein